MKFWNTTQEYSSVPHDWLTYDDVLLIPQTSTIDSRNNPALSLRTLLTPNIEIANPIVAANMDTVCGAEMYEALYEAGAVGFLHRNEPVAELISPIPKDDNGVVFISLTLSDWSDEEIKNCFRLGYAKVVGCLDIAHGHMTKSFEFIRVLKKKFGDDLDIISGSVANHKEIHKLVDAGVDTIRMGVGGGSACSTRVITGHGVPNFTNICLMKQELDKMDRHVCLMADGGIRSSGDIVKALAAGADSVMIGSLLAGTTEAPGEVIIKDGKKYKKYRGQASKDFMQDNNKQGVTPEGESMLLPYKGSVVPIIKDLIGGIKSGLTYSGAYDIKDLREKAEFIKITQNGFIESTPHGLSRIY